MLEVLSVGFLGNRADLMSDVLLVALVLIVPALLVGAAAGRMGRLRLHRALMLSVIGVVVLYVVLYEASMMAQGGMTFLRSRLRMPETPYFVAVAAHVLVALVSLVVAAMTVKRGQRAYRYKTGVEVGSDRGVHRRWGRVAFALLVVSVVSGIGIYYLTFVYVSV